MKKLTKKNYEKAANSYHKWKTIGWKPYYFLCEKCEMKIVNNCPQPATFCGYI